MSKLTVFLLPVAAATICSMAIVLARPWLVRYALARPNARSSHQQPTPQGGGIAVVGTTLLLAVIFAAADPSFGQPALVALTPMIAAATLLALVGAVDDIRTLGAMQRLIWQLLAVAAIVVALPVEIRIVPMLPLWIERALTIVGTLWFVNLVNFMDGIDWMSVAEFVPLTGALILLDRLEVLPAAAALPTYALFGALIGFAPFNRPVARLFLGDVGSLPIGLIVGWLLFQLAASGHVTAAFLLPLYYTLDATLTLLHRIAHGEDVMQAHRAHFYQRATDRGFTVLQIVARVFTLNVVLAAIAIATVCTESILIEMSAVGLGMALVGGLLAHFARGRP